MNKEELKQIALTANIGKAFEVIEITEHKEHHFTIFIESLEGITIDDCAAVLRHIIQQLPQPNTLELTVSSAGIDKPLRAPIQFLKHIGKKVEIKTRDGKKHIGTLHEYTPTKTTIIQETKKEKIETVFLNEFIQSVKIIIF
ncbi:MAG: hypothetical protein N2449_01150 [Bacteroidales bacterium]|nr:hypothetical protein [Bacteroidales bacterium]